MRALAAVLGLSLVLASPVPASAQPMDGMSKSQVTLMRAEAGMAWIEATRGEPTRTCAEGMTTCLVNWQINSIYTCPKGGRIITSGTITGTIEGNNLMTEQLSGTVTQTITNWRCVKGWVVDGDPYINILYEQTGFSSTQKITGGWKAVGPKKVKQSCQLRGTESNTRYICKPGGTWRQ